MSDRDDNKMILLKQEKIMAIADGGRDYCDADVEQLARRLLNTYKEQVMSDSISRDQIELLLNRISDLEESQRWRKCPEEKPEVEQHCQLILANNSFPHLCCSIYPFAHWENLNATHWRPIGPLPKEIE